MQQIGDQAVVGLDGAQTEPDEAFVFYGVETVSFAGFVEMILGLMQ